MRVEGGDVDGIAVTTVPPGSIAGRILRDPRANGQLPSSVRVRLIPSYDRMQFAERLLEAVTDRQGAFRIEEAFGPQFVVVAAMPAGWFVQAIRVGGEDISEVAHEFRGTNEAMDIVLSDRSADAKLRVIDGDGRPLDDAIVVLLPTDPAKRKNPLLTTQPVGKSGRAEFKGLKPGSYLAVAITPEDLTKAWRLAGHREALAAIGQAITLVEGNTLMVDVPVRALGGVR